MHILQFAMLLLEKKKREREKKYLFPKAKAIHAEVNDDTKPLCVWFSTLNYRLQYVLLNGNM